MSAANPESAVDAVVGKSYMFRGKEISFRMIALFALEKAGIPLTKLGDLPLTGTFVILFAVFSPISKVWQAMRFGNVVEKAEEFANSLTPKEIVEANEIVGDMISRYTESIMDYSSGDAEGNGRAGAGNS